MNGEQIIKYYDFDLELENHDDLVNCKVRVRTLDQKRAFKQILLINMEECRNALYLLESH